MHWYQLAYAMTRELDAAYDALNVLPPTYAPAATGHIPEMVTLIGELIEAGHAYPASDGSGDVYFDVLSWSSYGELSGQRVDDMEPAGDADPRGKRDPRDFALWKGRKSSEPETASWPSPWGPGRPGWHIECSAMAGKYLGPAFDIHGGGVDLRFPHHENEQAQSRAAGRPFASYWLHNAWITTAGEKMSKSLGNSLVIPEVLKRVRGIELRYYLVSAHYRSHVEFSFEALDEAAVGVPADRELPGAGGGASSTAGSPLRPTRCGTPSSRRWTTTWARRRRSVASHDMVREGNRLLRLGRSRAGHAARGARSPRPRRAGSEPEPTSPPGRHDDAALIGAVDALVRGMLEQRAEARAEKDFGTADAIRDRIAAAGIVVTDTPDGPEWSLEAGS